MFTEVEDAIRSEAPAEAKSRLGRIEPYLHELSDRFIEKKPSPDVAQALRAEILS
jgi:hypothetical protein